MRVLSIDAWAGEEVGCWDWNNWYTCGNIDKDVFEGLKTDQEYATWFCENGYTTSDDLSLCIIEDDGHNVTICDVADGRPLFAIEYGPEY